MATPAAATSALRRRADLDVLTWPVFDAFDVDVAVTTRNGGVSSGPYASLNLGLHVGDEAADVLENRRRAAAALDADPADFVFCIQAHGPNVQVVTASDRGRGALTQQDAIAGTDALVTRDAGVVLTVMVADCVPIVLYDPVAHVLACVHAGWRGTVARVSEAAVESMRSLGSNSGDVIAALGPGTASVSVRTRSSGRTGTASGCSTCGRPMRLCCVRRAWCPRTCTWRRPRPDREPTCSSVTARSGPAAASRRSPGYVHGTAGEQPGSPRGLVPLRVL
jgi:copper oxidase (laccase) domain-containing protein